MSPPSAEPPTTTPPAPSWRRGLVMGLLGMLAFSGTLPATRLAVPSFTPTLITAARIEIAALLAVAWLLWKERAFRPPDRRYWPGILWMGFGLAVAYPFFVALAMESVPFAHGAVVVGLAPPMTVMIAVLRAGERPPPTFWIACGVGITAVLVFAVHQGGGYISLADGWLLLAMLSVGVAYVEGGRVSREVGATTTLCWAMIAMAPLAFIPFVLALQGRDWSVPIAWASRAGLTYACVISMFLGSVAWYRGLAGGGIARIGQLNLILPMLTLLWSAFLLDEPITVVAVICAIVVLASMIACVRSRVSTVPPSSGARNST